MLGGMSGSTEETGDALADRVARLERRVAELEGRPAPASQTTSPEGLVTYSGELTEPLSLEWSIRMTPAASLALPDGPRVEVLAALAHPARIAIVRALASAGVQSGTALQQIPELGSVGQFYHHLKALTGAGIVEQDKRGSYRLRPQATIPALLLLTAASDIAGQLR
jgi:ArsR family transcriptional regulator